MGTAVSSAWPIADLLRYVRTRFQPWRFGPLALLLALAATATDEREIEAVAVRALLALPWLLQFRLLRRSRSPARRAAVAGGRQHGLPRRRPAGDGRRRGDAAAAARGSLVARGCPRAGVRDAGVPVRAALPAPATGALAVCGRRR